MEPVLEVLSPGLLTTVQDTGRLGFGHLGVPRSGAADPWSLAVANALLGNPPDSAALECTLVGPELRALRNTVIAIGGADLGAVVRPAGRRLASNAAHNLAAGDVLAIAGPVVDDGARAYLALPGGIHVPLVLGSRSTCLAAGFGGLDGRPLRSGDQLATVSPSPSGSGGVAWPRGPGDPRPEDAVRILPGPAIQGTPKAMLAAARALAAGAWTVAPASDRQGVRLVGAWASAAPALDAKGDWLSHGVIPGAVQLPPDGKPIVLLADAQPTGGYPVIAVVVAADLPIVGQLGPGRAVRFGLVSADEAATAWIARRAALAAGTRRLRASAGWDELWQSAGG